MPYYVRSDVMQELLDALIRCSGIVRDSVIGNRIEDLQNLIENRSVFFDTEPLEDPAAAVLPQPTATYVPRKEEPQEFSAEQIRGFIVNPLNLGMIPGTSPMMSSEEWVKKVAVLIRQEGVEQTLVNMLAMMGMSLLDSGVRTKS